MDQERASEYGKDYHEHWWKQHKGHFQLAGWVCDAMCWHQVRKCDLKGALDHRGYKGTAEEVMMDITLLLTCRRCYDHCIWTLFSSFSSCFLLTHVPCSWLGLPFCDSCALTQTVLSWLILGHLSQALEAVWWLMDLIHDSPLFVLVYYKLWLFNYKYHVVAVVRPQSCLCPLLAIQVIPLSTSVSLELLHSPLNHRTIEPQNPCIHSYPAHVEHTKTLQGLDRGGYKTKGTFSILCRI